MQSALRKIEWPTVGLATGIYGLWWLFLIYSDALGHGVTAVVLVPLLVLHSSLQHECIHGHPFPDQRLNDLIAGAGIGVLLPYGRFAALHRAHHATDALTDPRSDPESHYVSPESWRCYGPVRRWCLHVNRCLAGRMLVGPPLSLYRLIRQDIQSVIIGGGPVLRAWLSHGVTAGATLYLVSAVAGFPLWLYLLCCWAALSILAIRTYLEHRAVGPVASRSVVIEHGGALGFLFLNNHLHAVHHARPRVPWYRLPALFRANRARFLRQNGGYAYPSYGAVARRYLLSGKEPAVFPLAASIGDDRS